MEASIIFRPFEPQDIHQIAKIEALSFRPEIAFDHPKIRDLCMNDDLLCFVLESKTEDNPRFLIGSVFLKLEKFKNTLIIVSLAIHPDYRRQKLGSRVITRIQEMCSYLRVNRLIVQVESNNQSGVLFFEHNTFLRKRDLDNFWEENNTGLEMELLLPT